MPLSFKISYAPERIYIMRVAAIYYYISRFNIRKKAFNYTVYRLTCWYQHHHFAWFFKTAYHFFKGSYAFYYFLYIGGCQLPRLYLFARLYQNQ